MQTVVNKVSYLKGETEVAPDKSISHRTVILSALAEGRSRVKNFWKLKIPGLPVNASRPWD